MSIYIALLSRKSLVRSALNTLVSREKPGFRALSKGLIVLPCAEIARQGVPDMLPYYCGSECTREKPRAANGRRQRSDAVAIKSAAYGTLSASRRRTVLVTATDMANVYGITSILLAVTAGILILLMTQTTPTEALTITYEPYVSL